MAAKRAFPRKLQRTIARLLTRSSSNDFRQEFRSLLRDLNVYRVQLETDNKWLQRAQAELKETHHRVIDLFNNAPIGYLSLDLQGHIKSVNTKACRILGAKPENLVSYPLSSFVVSDDRDKLIRHITTSQTASQEVVTRLRFTASSGRQIILQLISERWGMNEKHSAPTEVRTALVDVSSARMDDMAEGENGSALRAGREAAAGGILHEDTTPEKQFQDMIDSSPAIIYVKDLAGRYLVTNQHLERLLGRTREELKGKTDYDFFPKRSADRYRARERKVIENGMPVQAEETMEFANHRRHVFLADRFALYNSNGRAYATCAILQDITNRKQMEEALRESEERLSRYLENSPLAIIEWDRGVMVKHWSRQASRMFGYAREEAVGRYFQELNLVHPDDLWIVSQTMERLSSGKESSVVAENRNITKDGRVISCIWFNSVVRNAEGEMTSVISRVEDVTEERNAKVSLERTVTSLGVLVANSRERMVLFDGEGIILYASERAAAAVGYTAREVQGQPWVRFLPQEQLLSARFCFADLRRNQPSPTLATIKVRSASGTLVWVSLLASVVSLGDAEGFLVHIDPLPQ